MTAESDTYITVFGQTCLSKQYRPRSKGSFWILRVYSLLFCLIMGYTVCHAAGLSRIQAYLVMWNYWDWIVLVDFLPFVTSYTTLLMSYLFSRK